jgi:hypothetical protein
MLIVMMVALPSALYAIGMEGFVDEVFLQTENVGKVRFSHSFHGTRKYSKR